MQHPPPVPDARLRLPRALLLALLALLHLHSSAAQSLAEAGPYGDGAVIRAPPQFTPVWSNQVFPAAGFCLTEGEGRVLTNWTTPLYERRIVMAVEGGAGLPMVWAWIVKILVQELIGHQVWWYDSAASTDTFYNRLVLNPPERRVDIEIQSNLQAAAPSEDYRLHVIGSGEVAQKGSHAHATQGGIYITRSSLERYPEYAMESWRAFTMGDNALKARPLYPDDNRLLQLFRNDSWATLDSLRRVYGTMDMLKDFNGKPVCLPVMEGRDGRAFETGCTDPNFPSMYFPPQCYPNPRAQCALIFATTPVWLGSYMQGQVRTLNLSLGIAFLNVIAFGQPALVSNPAKLNLIMYSDANQQAANNECTFGDQQLHCWQRMQLPPYTSLCTGLYNRNYTSPYSCDFPLTQQNKYARPSLAQVAPRVDFFLQSLDFNAADTFWFFQQPQLKTASARQDHKSVACSWIKQAASRARWQSWIAPPAACTVDDTEFVVSACDESTAEHTITYSWKQPKACVGGWALPEPEQVSCGYVTASISWQVACMAVAAVLLLFHVTVALVRVFEDFNNYRTSRRIAAAQVEAAKTRAQHGGGKSHIVTIPSAKSGTSSVVTAAMELRRRMPIFGVCGSSIYPMHFGFLLLLLVPFVQTGPVSEALCWVRYSFTVGGVIAVQQVLATLLGTLINNLNRSLQANHAQNLVHAMAASDVVLFATLLASALGSDGGLATSIRVASPGGGSVWLDQCDAPAVWVSAVHVAICCIWAAVVGVSLVRALVRVYFSTSSAGRTYATLTRSKSKRQSVTRVQLVQANSIAAAFIIWLVTSVLLFLPLYGMMADEYHPEALLLSSSIVVLVGTTTCWLALFGPSLWRAYAWTAGKPSRAAAPGKKVHAASAVASAVAVTALSSGGTGQGGAVSANTAPGSTNMSISSDALTDDSVNDDRDMAAVSLASVLRDPILLLHLRRYAESNFDAEAVHFLLQCQALYQQLKHATLNFTQVMSGLEVICDEFIVDSAPQQVNISSSLRDSTLAAVQDLRLSAVAQARNRLKPASAEFKAQARKCLQEAVGEVYALVQVNSYPRFLNSAALRRSQHLMHWSDGFDELDDEEQAAMMTKLRDAQASAAAAARRMAADDHPSQSGAVGGSMLASAAGSGQRKHKTSDTSVLHLSRVPGANMAETPKMRTHLRLHDGQAHAHAHAGPGQGRLTFTPDHRPIGSVIPSPQHQGVASTTSGHDSNCYATTVELTAQPAGSRGRSAEPEPRLTPAPSAAAAAAALGLANPAALGLPADQLCIDVHPTAGHDRSADHEVSHATLEDADDAEHQPSLPGATDD